MIEGVIYNHQINSPVGYSIVTTVRGLSRGEKIRFFILRTIGNFFVLVSLYGLFITFGPVMVQEAGYRYRRVRGIDYVVADVSRTSVVPQEVIRDNSSKQSRQSFFASLITANKQQTLVPVDTDFGIVIPKIGANAKVIANVDASDYDTYMKALKHGVAHAVGTGLPGLEAINRNIYLFAHSTDYPWNVGRYNAIFYLIKELEAGDEVDLFYNGKRYIYIVEEKKIVGPDEVEYLTEPKREEQLVLQTCYPPGTTLERLLVFAKPKAAVVAEPVQTSFGDLVR